MKLARRAADVPAWVEWKWRNGFVRVVSIKCTGCGSWVDASDWDPNTAVCDWCTERIVAPGMKASRSTRARRVVSDGAR